MDARPDRPFVTEDERYGHLRSEPRDSMLLLATMRRPGRAEVQVKVRNLSTRGLMAETPINFLRGEPVEIDLRGIGWVTGRIAWATVGRAGVAFDEAVDPKMARKPVVAAAQPQLVRASKTMWRPGFG